MNHHPLQLQILGRISKELELTSFLNSCKVDDRNRLYGIMKLRMWAHAHLFSAVLAFMIFQAQGSVEKTLIIMALGSVSFALFEIVCGKFADDYGRAKSIRIGLFSMAFLCCWYGFGLWLSSIPKLIDIGNYTLIVCQSLIGIPLAFINGADTILTRETFIDASKNIEEDFDGKINASDFDSYCSGLKYIGVAIAAATGVLILTSCNFLFGEESLIPQIILIFGGSAMIQIFASRYSRFAQGKHVNVHLEFLESKPSKGRNTRPNLFTAAKQIGADKSLRSWLILAAGISGFLLYSKYHFELIAMRDLMIEAEDSFVVGIGLSFLVGLLQYFSSKGSNAFRWFNKFSDSANGNEIGYVNKALKSIKTSFQGSSSLVKDSIEANRIIGALGIITIIIFIYVLNFLFEFFGFTSNNITAGIIALSIYSLFNYLRGFAQQLLKSVIARIAEFNYPDLKTSIVSMATAGGGIAHILCSLLFTILISVSIFSGDSFTPSSSILKALVATVVIVVLALLILGLFAGSFVKGEEKIPEVKRVTDLRFDIIAGFFFTCLILANILAVKLVPIGWILFNAGAIAYAMTFTITDAITEVYGDKLSKRIWKAGIASYPISFLLIIISVKLPAAESESSLNFAIVLGPALLPLLGSICSFTTSQWFDIWAFSKLKDKVTGPGKFLGLRNIISTLPSQALDTIIFVSIAFIGEWWGTPEKLIQLFIGQLIAKWIITILAMPLLYFIVAWLRGSNSKARIE